MAPVWGGKSYDLVRRNCCSFANEFCEKLGVGPIPGWVNRLAQVGASTLLAAQLVASKVGSTESSESVPLPCEHKTHVATPKTGASGSRSSRKARLRAVEVPTGKLEEPAAKPSIQECAKTPPLFRTPRAHHTPHQTP